MSEPVIEVVKQVLADVREIDPAEVTADSLLVDDLGADSLDAIEIIMALETHYDKEFDGEEVEDLKTVGDIVNLVESILERAE